MKKTTRLFLAVAALAVIIGIAVVVIRLINGAVAVAGGIFNTVLGIIIIVALLAIVIWMFSFAKKHKK